MTRYDVENWNRYDEEERQKLEREHERCVKDYNRMNVFISVELLDFIKWHDTFVYEKLMKREDIPKGVIDWFWQLYKERK